MMKGALDEICLWSILGRVIEILLDRGNHKALDRRDQHCLD